jgi:2-octaprenylphenol hydroxylase
MNVVVVGGGLVGATTALALSEQGYAVTVLDEQVPVIRRGRLGVDVRNVALNPQSQQLLDELGIWSSVPSQPYQAMHVWEQWGSAGLDFTASDLGRDELGWLVEMSPLQTALYEGSVARCRVVEAKMLDVHFTEGGARVTTTNDETLEADFVIASDGVQSSVRQSLDVKVRKYPLAQHALATVVATTKPHQGVAYQRFLSDGPLALLPAPSSETHEHLVSVVWSQSESCLDQRLQQSEEEFCAAITRASEGVLGEIVEVDDRYRFPLVQQLVESFVVDCKVVLLGDAARVVHPLAGLGVNLGFEDVLALLQVTKNGTGLTSEKAVRKFARARQTRSRHMIELLSVLQGTYQNTSPALSWLRNVAVGKLNDLQWVKQQIMREAMGLGPIARIDKP